MMRKGGLHFAALILTFAWGALAIVQDKIDKTSDQLYFVDRFGFQKGGFVDLQFNPEVSFGCI